MCKNIHTYHETKSPVGLQPQIYMSIRHADLGTTSGKDTKLDAHRCDRHYSITMSSTSVNWGESAHIVVIP